MSKCLYCQTELPEGYGMVCSSCEKDLSNHCFIDKDQFLNESVDDRLRMNQTEYMQDSSVVTLSQEDSSFEHRVGDICLYSYQQENRSRSIVEIVDILDDERGIAKIKFHNVFVDDTGNGYFNYLLETGRTMNASFKYLKTIIPECEVVKHE